MSETKRPKTAKEKEEGGEQSRHHPPSHTQHMQDTATISSLNLHTLVINLPVAWPSHTVIKTHANVKGSVDHAPQGN